MAKIRLTKEFFFEMAHALWNYDGACSNIHGHSYRLLVTVLGEPIDDPSHPKNGMVMDFGELKKIVNEEIVKPFDHAVVISSLVPPDMYSKMGVMMANKMVVDYQPTCENFLNDFQERIQKNLPSHLKLVALILHETPTSYAEWLSSDNE